MLQLPTKSARRTEKEISAAGRSFEKLLQQYFTVHHKWVDLALKTRADALAMCGNPEWEGLPGDHPMWPHHRRISKKNGYDKICREQSALDEKMQELADFIWATPPTTPEGFRAHALVAVWECRPFSIDDPNICFGDEYVHQKLFDAVVNFAGIARMVDGWKNPDVTAPPLTSERRTRRPLPLARRVRPLHRRIPSTSSWTRWCTGKWKRGRTPRTPTHGSCGGYGAAAQSRSVDQHSCSGCCGDEA